MSQVYQPKTFWQKPEGKTGMLFMIAAIGFLAYFVLQNIASILLFAANTLGLIVILGAIAFILYLLLNPKMRLLISYMFKSIMRGITSVFVTIDPIGILKNYISDLEDNLSKMTKQLSELRGQMRFLKDTMLKNNQDIQQNLLIAKKAKELNNQQNLLLSSRKAARLRESNEKYEVLHNKISILYKVLAKMQSNSAIVLEDTKDQVKVKEQEYRAIKASHSAMQSAMNIIKGDADKRALFDQSLEYIADDVAHKVGEMEEFMSMSQDFMSSIDLQSGIFEEKGLQMLEEYEKKSTLLLLGGTQLSTGDDTLDLNSYTKEKEVLKRDNDYNNLFD